MTSRTVLAVDDDVDVLETLEMVLEGLGCQVLVARDGHEALVLLRSGRRPDLILLDLMMPGMNGWQFRAEQQNDRALSSIPTIALTGDVRAHAQATGFTAVIRKPIPFDVLKRVVEDQLGAGAPA
jgi:CheY-like chemotaxis protein